MHVVDVARAILHVSSMPTIELLNSEAPPGFNIADASGTTFGVLAELIERIFGITTSFAGSLKSQVAKLHLSG